MTETSQDTDIAVKILEENANYIAEFICIQFNESSSFKCANITPIFKYQSINHKTFDVFWNNSFKISVWFPESFRYLTLSPFDD